MTSEDLDRLLCLVDLLRMQSQRCDSDNGFATFTIVSGEEVGKSKVLKS
jgi:hypothetical protein